MDHYAYNVRIAGLVMAWVRDRSKSKEMKIMADLDKRRDQIDTLIECLNDEALMFDHGIESAALECYKERAVTELDMFIEDFETYDDYDYFMSDEFYSDEHLALVQDVENRLLAMAAKLRNRRFNAVNKRIAELGTAEGDYLNRGAGI